MQTRTLIATAVAVSVLGGPARAGTIPPGEKPSLAPIVRAVTPGVVNIATKKVEVVDNAMMRDPVMRDLFDIPERGVRRETQAAGSGVIVDAARGYVLTNDHVVKGASNIEVTTKDNRRFRAQLVGRDQGTDIALLHIKAENIIAVPLGDSNSLEVGDFVLAIGNPFGLGQTVTSGIVSALGRADLGIEGYEDFVQTDAAINPGNSGGALVTLDGRLVGINTAILSKTGGNVGISFAVPINMARLVMAQLIASGEVKRGRIGVTLRNVTPVEPSRPMESEGALIEAVEPQSPAAQAGLSKGDIVLAANSVAIKSSSQFRNLIGLTPVGSQIDVRFRRGNEMLSAKVQVEPLKGKAPTQHTRRN
ncbi:MAG TPA: trypsin-like peptidase domain-containing protein [Xanthobacteraceae bacterium]|jgi:Do/DeqQ family serine protease